MTLCRQNSPVSSLHHPFYQIRISDSTNRACIGKISNETCVTQNMRKISIICAEVGILLNVSIILFTIFILLSMNLQGAMLENSEVKLSKLHVVPQCIRHPKWSRRCRGCPRWYSQHLELQFCWFLYVSLPKNPLSYINFTKLKSFIFFLKLKTNCTGDRRERTQMSLYPPWLTWTTTATIQ